MSAFEPALAERPTLEPPPGLALRAAVPASAADIADADRNARFWRWEQPGKLSLGSDAHKHVVCRMFRETFNPYKPSIIDWPVLDPDARARLVSLPIWDIAVQTEGKARLRMLSYAQSLIDPAWHDAIELNGWEEGRHKIVLANLVQAYGIPLAEEPAYVPPRRPSWAYMVTGYSECIDSFFAFGLFELAKRSAFFPPDLVDTFEPVMQEECRHILLFANWVAWTRRTTPFWRRPWLELRIAAVWLFLGWERLGIARGMDDKPGSANDHMFTVNGSKAVSDVDISVPELMDLCLLENTRRFAGYDERLVRPTTMPALVRFARLFLRVKKPRAGRNPGTAA